MEDMVIGQCHYDSNRACFLFASPMLAAELTETADVQAQVIQVLKMIAFFQPVIGFSNVFAGCR